MSIVLERCVVGKRGEERRGRGREGGGGEREGGGGGGGEREMERGVYWIRYKTYN